MSKEVKLELEEQVLKALSNIEGVIFSSNKFLVDAVNYSVDNGFNNSLSISLDINLKPHETAPVSEDVALG